MNTANIPTDLKAKKQWVCFRKVVEDGKLKKIIISPVTGSFAKCNEPDTWTSFENALAYCEDKKLSGLVFALSGSITFIDIDHCVNTVTGVISDAAKKILELLPDTYTELSVSGTGIHILAYGNLPDNALKRNDKLGIEMYDKNRFVCITCDVLSGEGKILDYSDKIEFINHTFIGRHIDIPIKNNVSNYKNKTDDELTDLILNSKQGFKFSSLYNGQTAGYESHSNADFALINILAFWTSDDMQIDRIFRSSGLYRDKWDRRLGNSTYGQVTIENALKCSREKYGKRDMEL